MRFLVHVIAASFIAGFLPARELRAQEQMRLTPPANSSGSAHSPALSPPLQLSKSGNSNLSMSGTSGIGTARTEAIGDSSGVSKKAGENQPKSSGIDIDRLLTKLALDNMPHTYDDDRKWGMQAERWDGLHIHRDGWKIETKRRKKMVNHGTWRKYSAQLVNPLEEFSVKVGEFSKLPNGDLGFDISFTAHIALQGRQSEFVKGVQIYSLSADGTAKVRLKLQCELDIDLDFEHFPPDVIFSPVVTDATLNVDEFKLDRISKVGGEFAQQMTRASRSLLDGKIAEKEDKLVEKINSQIDEKRDRLTISLSEAIDSDWTEKALPHLPIGLQSIIRASK